MALRIASALTPRAQERTRHTVFNEKVLMSAIGPKRTQPLGRPTAPWRYGRSPISISLVLERWGGSIERCHN
jgi:hypothetical protein